MRLLASIDLPAGFDARPARRDDVDDVLAVIRASEASAGQAALTTREDVLGDWDRPSMDLATDSLLVEHDGVVVAHGELFQARAFVFVHPDHTGRGIGTALADWTEQRAVQTGCARVGQTLSDSWTDAQALLRSRGYVPLFSSWILRMSLDRPLAIPQPPPGVTLRTLRRPEDEAAVHEVIETAFSEWPDRDVVLSADDWAVSHLDRSDATPSVRLVLEEDSTIVGALIGAVEDDVGWVDQLAVAATHRGRGFARLLLTEAFIRFQRAGLHTVELNTDSRTGARSLYERVGMQVSESFTRLALTLPATDG